MVLRKTGNHYETLIPVVGAYWVANQAADINALSEEKKRKIYKVSKDLDVAFAPTQTQKASIVHDEFDIFRERMLKKR